MQLKQLILEQLQTNQFLSGGMILGALGSFLMMFRTLPEAIWQRIKRQIHYTVVVEYPNDLYQCVQDWVATYYGNELKSPRAIYTYKTQEQKEDYYVRSAKGKTFSTGEIEYKQNQDYFYIWRGPRYIKISASEEKLENAQSLSTMFYRKFFISGYFAKNQINKILQEAVACSEKLRAERLVPKVYQKDYDGWSEIEVKLKPIEAVFLPGDVKEKIIEDLGRFYGNEDFYTKRGIPYRRGYCLYGPPGTGKSSLVSALALHFRKDLCLLNLNTLTTDSSFEELMQRVPSGSMLLIEDVDSFFQKRRAKTKVSFSAFINAISGVAAKHGVVLFLTTNDPSSLDAALTRAGRVDHMFEIGNPTAEQVSNYMSFFYNSPVKLTKVIKTDMATVENICIQNEKITAIKIISGN